MLDLSDLIARVEAASGADRELDALIDCAIRFPDLRPARPDDHKEYQRGFPPSKGDIWCPTGFLMARSYTRLIDDALTLLPYGLDYLVRTGKRSNGERPYGHVFDGYNYGIGEAEAETPCLALLSATLKARQASTEGAK